MLLIGDPSLEVRQLCGSVSRDPPARPMTNAGVRVLHFHFPSTSAANSFRLHLNLATARTAMTPLLASEHRCVIHARGPDLGKALFRRVCASVEAFARDRPVLGANVGAIPELLGAVLPEWLFEGNSVPALRTALERLLSGALAAPAPGVLERHAREQFGREKLGREYLALLGAPEAAAP